MAKDSTGDSSTTEPMSDKELKRLLHLVANELNARLSRGDSGQGVCKKPLDETVEDSSQVESGMDTELCDALFAVSAATQAAIIANGCAGA